MIFNDEPMEPVLRPGTLVGARTILHNIKHQSLAKREDDGATRFGGYADAAEQIFLELGLCKVGDAKLQLSDNMQHQRAKLVEYAKASAQKSGCMGYSEFPRILSYVSYSDVWELPIYHAGLYGIVKGFMAFLLSDFSGSDCPQHVIPKKLRSLMREHGKKLRLTAEFGRPHKSALLHYFRIVVVDDDLLAPGSTFNNDVRHQAQGNLLRYASLVEQHLPESLLTYNLHILVCRLYKQEEARGCIATCGELWVERSIQHVQSHVKYRTTSCPEKLYVHDLLVDEALSTLQHDDDTSTCVRAAVKTLDVLVPKYRANIRAGPLYDTGDDVKGTQLIGKGS
ncbi:TPA: hypothetical protein ACH3X1_014785 [Trebouxia sp. C0004]